MEVIPDPWRYSLEIIVFIAILAVLAFLNAADKAVESASRNNIKNLAEEGNQRAKRLQFIFAKPSNLMGAVKIAIIFLSLLAGWLLFDVIRRGVWASGNMPRDLMPWYPLVYIGVWLLVTLLVVSLAMIFPRQIATKHPESVALALSGYALFFSRLLRPFVMVARGVASLVLCFTGQGTYEEEVIFSEEDVKSMLEAGKESGELKEESGKLIDSIFAFDDKLAYEIMTPRTDVFSIDINDEPDEYMEELMQLRYSRIPAYDEDSDNIVGILNVKDYFMKAKEQGFDNIDIKEILRQPFFVPDTKNIDNLFFELQKRKQHIAILIDEYGGFSGICTMEDIIEEVMGDIDDEYDEEETEITQINYNTYYVDGNADLDDLNEELGTQLVSDDSETIGGFIIDILGEIPEDGTQPEVRYANYIFQVEEVKDRRIEQVKLTIRDEEDMAKEAAERETEEAKQKENGIG